MKSLVDPAREAAPAVVSGATTPRSYASVVAPQMTKTTVPIRINGARDLQPQELLSKAKEHIQGAYAIRQIRGIDTEVFIQSASQRDAALNMCWKFILWMFEDSLGLEQQRFSHLSHDCGP